MKAGDRVTVKLSDAPEFTATVVARLADMVKVEKLDGEQLWAAEWLIR